MRAYIKPRAAIVRFEERDVITASGEPTVPGEDGTETTETTLPTTWQPEFPVPGEIEP